MAHLRQNLTRMREIPLTNHPEAALVDDADYELASSRRWLATRRRNTWYAQSTTHPRVYLHRLILGLRRGDGVQADHRNGNGLDNRRQNLRKATQADNAQNRITRSASGHRGIWFDPRWAGGRWRVVVQLRRRHIYLGSFPTKDAAVEAVTEWRRSNMPFATQERHRA